MILVKMHMNRSQMLMDRLGFVISSAFWMKGQVLHRERADLKIPGWLSDFSVVRTRKLPVLLSRLKDTSSGSEIFLT